MTFLLKIEAQKTAPEAGGSSSSKMVLGMFF